MNLHVYDVLYYVNHKGKAPFIEWLKTLDKPLKERIRKKLNKVILGNLGDYKHIDEGVFEFRLNFSSGYRIYFAKENNAIILLLSAGDKSTQTSDIAEAKIYLKDFKAR